MVSPIYKTKTLFAMGVLSAVSLSAQEVQTEVPELEAYVMTGTRTERIITEAPVKTELFTASDLEEYHVSSFKDAIKLIPSARFESDCQNCGLNQIQLLGLSTDYTSILFDGAPMYSGLAKVYGADIFPAIFIDRIEVVKGGSSVLYGPEAIAGVVNLITEAPYRTGGEVSTTVKHYKGDAEEYEASFKSDYVSQDKTNSLTVYGYYKNRDAIDLTTDGFSEIPEMENKVIGLEDWWNPVSGGTLKVSYQYIDESHRGGDQLDISEEQARVAESLAHEIHMGNVEWKHLVNADFDYVLRGSFMYIDRTSFYGARADNEQRAYEEAGYTGDVTDAFIAANQDLINEIAHNVWGSTQNTVFYLDSQFNHYINNHTVSYGVQYRYEKLEDGSLYDEDIETTEDDFSNISFFVQDQWAVSKKLEIVPGGRIDKHDNVDDLIFSPRLAARYTMNDEVTMRASWSTGFNAPGAFNEDKHIGVSNGGAIFLVNDEDLKEESSQTFSLGVDYQPEVFEKQVIFDSQIHYTLLKDTFEIDDSGDVSGDENLWLRVNGPDSKIFVWENSVNWQIMHGLKLDAGISYIHARYDDPIERVTGLTTDEYIKRPEWTGHLGLTYENHSGWNLHGLLSYTGTMIAVGEDIDYWRNTPRFYVVDLGVSKTFEDVWSDTNLTLSVGVDNLFDERQDDVLDTGEDRDPTYLYGPTTPRTFYGTLRIDW